MDFRILQDGFQQGGPTEFHLLKPRARVETDPDSPLATAVSDSRSAVAVTYRVPARYIWEEGGGRRVREGECYRLETVS